MSLHDDAPLLCGVLVLLLASSGLSEPAPPIPIEAFFSNPTFQSPRLSSDGEHIAVLYSQGDQQVVISRATTGGSATPLATLMDPETRLNWLEWANPDRLLLSGTARNQRSVAVRGRVTRLFGVDREGGRLTWLGRRWEKRGQGQWEVQFQDQIISWLPDDPDHVLISYHDPARVTPSVKLMDVHTGKLKTRQRSLKKVDVWYADARGRVRAGEGGKRTEYVLYARVKEEDDLREVHSSDVFEDSAFGFAAFHQDPAKLYVLAEREGRSALFEFDIEKAELGSLVFARPEVDVASVIYRDPEREEVVGVRYIVDEPEAHYFDEEARSERAALDRALRGVFGGPTDNRIVSATMDGMLLIVHVSRDTQPPVYYVYDRRERSLTKLLDERPEVPVDQLVPMKRVTYITRDGLEIVGYLTLPRGAEPRKLPMIVLPHGGPWARDWKRYDPEVQMFANRGFAVLQMNFRGSTGFGTGFTRKGRREWGQAIQDDITDGVKWAIEQGIADPDRIGIYGGSYGGYSAMMGLVRTPELYRAGASYAGVMDIKLLIKHDRNYRWMYAWHEALIGGEWGDSKRLRKYSPVEGADEIRAPVLLGHGADDQRVHVQHSQNMARALRRAGKNFEYLEFEDEIHGFLLERNRIQFYERLVAFFEKNLAPRPPASDARGSVDEPADGA
jgi:dipeptidyl aminopeptidase/acylaminoacyl peptidase